MTELTIVTASSTTEVNKSFDYDNRNQLTSITDLVNAANNVTDPGPGVPHAN